MFSLKKLVQTHNSRGRRTRKKDSMKIQSDVFELRVMRTMLWGTGFSRKRGEIVLLYSCCLGHFLVWVAKEIQEWWLCFQCFVGWQNFHFLRYVADFNIHVWSFDNINNSSNNNNNALLFSLRVLYTSVFWSSLSFLLWVVTPTFNLLNSIFKPHYFSFKSLFYSTQILLNFYFSFIQTQILFPDKPKFRKKIAKWIL